MKGFPDGSDGKEAVCNAGDIRDMGLIPGSGRSPGEGHSNPLQDSCLENTMHRGAWWATVHRVAKSQTSLKRPSTHTSIYIYNSDFSPEFYRQIPIYYFGKWTYSKRPTCKSN